MLAAATAAAVIGTGVAAALAGPTAVAADALYTATGTIALPNPAGTGAGRLLFAATSSAGACEPGVENGVDAYVFALPADLVTEGMTATVVGESADGSDPYLSIWNDDCTHDRNIEDATGDTETATLKATTGYVLVQENVGRDVTVTLTVAPTPATATPTPTPTTSGSAAPAGRGTYPLTPNDPLFLQDGADDPITGGQWGMRRIEAPQAWQVAQATGSGITVAVLDTGLDVGHPDFACPGKVELLPGDLSDPDADGKSTPDDTNGHGTHVAGIIGACTDNGTGVVGVAPDSTVMPIQVLGEGEVDVLPQALRTAADNGAHVINMSLGYGIFEPVLGLQVPGSGTAAAFIGALEEIDAAVEYAVSKGVVVVAAAGNEDFPFCGFPALAEDVICVGASDSRDLNAWYGNFPLKTDEDDTVGPGLLAPGGTSTAGLGCFISSEEVLSTYSRLVEDDFDCDGLYGYESISGTSMASPHVAGVAALVYDRLGGARSPENAAAVTDAILSSATDLYAPGYDPASGYGLLNALGAVSAVDAVAPSPTGTPTPTEQPTRVTLDPAPASGQHSDSVDLAATLTDASGAPLAGKSLTFQLLGRDGFRQAAGVTGPDGRATAALPLDTPAGSYEVAVGFAGQQGVHGQSSDAQPFEVVREDTTTTLSVAGSGSKRTLTARVADADTAAAGLAGVVVTFFAGGAEVGSAVTNADGVATVAAPPGARGSDTAYQAVFGGSRDHVGSRGTA